MNFRIWKTGIPMSGKMEGKSSNDWKDSFQGLENGVLLMRVEGYIMFQKLDNNRPIIVRCFSRNRPIGGGWGFEPPMASCLQMGLQAIRGSSVTLFDAVDYGFVCLQEFVLMAGEI